MQPADDTTGIVEKTGSVFDHAYLANKINFVNFVGGTITAVYRNCEYGCTVHVPLHPLLLAGAVPSSARQMGRPGRWLAVARVHGALADDGGDFFLIRDDHVAYKQVKTCGDNPQHQKNL